MDTVIDSKFQDALTRFKNVDVKIEEIYDLFMDITKMSFDEIVAAKHTIDLFLSVSDIGEKEKKVMLSFREAIVKRCRQLHCKMKINTSEVESVFGEEGSRFFHP